MTKARNLSDLLDATGDVKTASLDNVPASDDASALTSGTLAIARLSDGSITSAKLNNDAKVVKSANAPTSPVEGNLWYDTTNEILKVYNSTDSAFIKVVTVTPTLTSISGIIETSTAGNLTLTGAGFLSSNLVVSFTPSGGSASTVTVTPTNDTTATVAIPSAIYGQSTGTVITIKVTNSDNKDSGTVNKTVTVLPSGGTRTNSGGYYYHAFTSSGTFSTSLNLTADILIVAGGGGGGYQVGGGGGAGGLVYASSQTLSSGNFTVTVGAGGAGSAGSALHGTQGGNSLFQGQTTAIGGGYGNSYTLSSAGSGGSGGGGTSVNQGAGSGTAGQGNSGGSASSANGGGGGGGFSASGGNASGDAGGVGGDGTNTYSTFATATSTGDNGYYAGGGGGCCNGTVIPNFSAGGNGGGARGLGDLGQSVTGTTNGDDADINTGGGGGGVRDFYSGTNYYTRAGNGGSGIVIVRYQI
jgi:hypothetical protein